MVQSGQRLGAKKAIGLTSDEAVGVRWFQLRTRSSPRGKRPSCGNAKDIVTKRKIVHYKNVEYASKTERKTGCSFRIERGLSDLGLSSTHKYSETIECLN